MDQQTIFIFCIAGAVTLVLYLVFTALAGPGNAKLRDRLSARSGSDQPSADKGKSDVGKSARALANRIGQAASSPFMPKDRQKVSTLRKQLGHAGIYSASAIKAMTGGKVICLGGGLIIGYVTGIFLDMVLLGLSVGGLIGYLAPSMWLKSKIKANQVALTQGLPDALDLMVVCVEAGLTIDAALQRVGQELLMAHPALSREFGIAHMETRVGLPRIEAIKNLGVRTGNPAIQSLAAMMVQADRFGTSIAHALRIQADTLRNNRQMAAEEMAAKASVKMSFPLVLFIFPATFIVLCGPTVIGLMNSPIMD